MFRKSVSFFILVALLWVLLWVYVPDATPDKLSISDLFRALFLVFSLMASGFALLMLVIRFRGIEIAKNLFPQGAVLMWLGKHAYEYSQPKVVIFLKHQMDASHITVEVQMAELNHQIKLQKHQSMPINLGVISENPKIKWTTTDGNSVWRELEIMQEVKLIGRNLEFDLIIEAQKFKFKKR